MSKVAFVTEFTNALTNGHLTDAQADSLTGALGRLVKDDRVSDDTKLIAARLTDLVRHDRQLDQNERPIARGWLAALGASPEQVRRVGGLAVPNVREGHVDLRYNFRGEPGKPVPVDQVMHLAEPAKQRNIVISGAGTLKFKSVKLAYGDTEIEVPFSHRMGRLRFRRPDEIPAVERIILTLDMKTADKPGSPGVVRDPNGEFAGFTWPDGTDHIMATAEGPKSPHPVSYRAEILTTNDITPIASGHLGLSRAGYTLQQLMPSQRYTFSMAGIKNAEILSAHGDSERGPLYIAPRTRDAKLRAYRQEYVRLMAATEERLAKWFGNSRYGSQVGAVEIPALVDGVGGMEHAGFFHIGAAFAKDFPVGAQICVHEPVHDYFGNSVYALPVDLWLIEGVTEYVEQVIQQEMGLDVKWRRNWKEIAIWGREAMKKRIDSAAKYPLRPNFEGAENIAGWAVFDLLPYAFAPFILRMLEKEIGTERFHGIMADWYNHAEGSYVDTAQFISFIQEKLEGTDVRLDLDAFAEKWIYNLPTVAELDAAIDKYEPMTQAEKDEYVMTYNFTSGSPEEAEYYKKLYPQYYT